MGTTTEIGTAAANLGFYDATATARSLAVPGGTTRTYRGAIAITKPYYTIAELTGLGLGDTIDIQSMPLTGALRVGWPGTITLTETFELLNASAGGVTIVGQSSWQAMTGANAGGSLLVRNGSLMTGVNSFWITQAAAPLTTQAVKVLSAVVPNGTAYSVSWQQYVSSGIAGNLNQGPALFPGKLVGAVPVDTDPLPWFVTVDIDGKVYITENAGASVALVTVTLDALHYYKVHVTAAGVLTLYVDGVLKFTGAPIAGSEAFDYIAMGRGIATASATTTKMGWDNVLLTLGDVAYDGSEIPAGQGRPFRSGSGGMIDLNNMCLCTEPGAATGSVEILVIGR